MYHAKLWDEDKWNIHSSSYNSSKDDKKYHEQKYGSQEKDLSSDYMKKEDAKEKDEKKKDEFFEGLEEKNEKKELKEEDVQFTAAKQVFAEQHRETQKIQMKKNIDSIEEAIRKAIDEEKKIIIMGS